MSAENNNNVNAVVKKEEDDAPLPAPVEQQAPLNSVPEAGSSSSAPSNSAAATAWVAVPLVPLAVMVAGPPATLPGPQQQPQDSTRASFIRETMHQCVAALVAGNVVAANAALVALSLWASADGDPLQRVAFAFAEALGLLALRLLPGLSWAMQHQVPRPPAPAVAAAARHCFHALCPLARVAASAANHAIAAAMEGERRVHVVELGGGASPRQWLDLLRAFAARPGGPPSLRLSVVSGHEEFLSRAAGLLTQEAVRLHVPFVFNPVRCSIDRFTAPGIKALGVERGEALALTSTLQLHRLIADVVTVELPAAGGRGKRKKQQSFQTTRADALLRALRDLPPKLVVLTEQEANHNGGPLWDRVRSAFDYYAVLFDDLEAGGAPRGSPDRAAVERVLLREEILDIVARDGAWRRERHEYMVQWAARMAVAGYERAAVMSSAALAETAWLAHQLSGDGGRRMYWVIKDDASFVIYSRMTPMLSVTAWRPASDAADR